MRVAVLVAPGVEATSLRSVCDALAQAGAAPRFVGLRLGSVQPIDGAPIEVEATVENMPSVLWDAVVLPDGSAAQDRLSADPLALDFVRDQHRHGKPMLVLDPGAVLLAAAGLPSALPDGRPDPGLVLAEGDGGDPAGAFLRALAARRHFDREGVPAA